MPLDLLRKSGTGPARAQRQASVDAAFGKGIHEAKQHHPPLTFTGRLLPLALKLGGHSRSSKDSREEEMFSEDCIPAAIPIGGDDDNEFAQPLELGPPSLPPLSPRAGGNESHPWPQLTTEHHRLTKTQYVCLHLAGREVFAIETHPSEYEVTHPSIPSCTNKEVLMVVQHLSYRGLLSLVKSALRTRCEMTPAGREFFRAVSMCISAEEQIESTVEYTWIHNINRLKDNAARRCEETYSGYALDVMELDEELRDWALRQFELLASGRLRFDLAVELLDIGVFCGDNFWTVRYKQLETYFEVNGHSNIPEQQDGSALDDLYWWTCEQRQKRQSNLLSPEKVGRLRELMFLFGCNRYGEYEPWGDKFAELVRYKRQHHHCNVPQSNGPLGKWVQHQRTFYKDGKLSQDRIDLLEGLGFAWNQLDVAWSDKFAELERFKEQHHHCNVPQRDGPLGKWTQKQRKMYKDGKLSQDRIDLLVGLGFAWKLKAKGGRKNDDVAWRDKFAELERFKEQHHHCNVPQSNGPLGMWVKAQRTNYKGGKLSQDRIDLLEGLGFAWKLLKRDLYDDAWRDKFAELERFKEQHHHCNVPRSNGPLGLWVAKQRTKYNGDNLSQDKIDLLEGLGFAWNKLDDVWRDKFAELERYNVQHHHCNVSQRDGPLGTWVRKQRTMYKDGKLSQERINLLGGLGFAWRLKRGSKNAKYEPWGDKFAELERYKRQHHHCNVPQRDGPLGKWVKAQRVMYKDGKLSQDRIDLLEGLGFAWRLKGGSKKRGSGTSVTLKKKKTKVAAKPPTLDTISSESAAVPGRRTSSRKRKVVSYEDDAKSDDEDDR